MSSTALKAVGAIVIVAVSFFGTLGILNYLNLSEGQRSEAAVAASAPHVPPVTPVAVTTGVSGSRDAQRRSDLHALQAAIEAYAKANGSYLVKGGGSGGAGIGFIDTSYPGAVSVVRALHDAGYLAVANIDDPDPAKRPGYMIYLCKGDKQYSISATLEHPTPEDIAHAKTTCNGEGPNGTYSNYGKNFSVGN